MFTINYLGWFIHGYIDKSECRVQNPLTFEHVGKFKSLHAAKCAIAKYMRKGLSEADYKKLRRK